MLKSPTLVLAATAVLALAGCQKSAADPVSPVVATVAGKPITLADVQAEQPGATAGAVDPAVLGRLINRRLLAQAAEDEKLDSGPEFAGELARGRDVALAGVKARLTGGNASPPMPAEIDAYIAARPDAFARRRLFVLEQITARRPREPLPVEGAITNLEQVAARLTAAGLPFQRGAQVVDSASTPPETLARLDALTPGALFEMSGPTIVAQAQVLKVVQAPLTGDAARAAAESAIRSERGNAAVAGTLEALRAKARDKIKLSPGYTATY